MDSNTGKYGLLTNINHVFIDSKILIMLLAVGLDWTLRDLDLLRVTQGQIMQNIELHHKMCCESCNRFIIVFCVLIS